MILAEIYSPWVEIGGERMPELINDYFDIMKSRGGGSISDVTGQDLSQGTPNPNLLAVQVKIDQVTLNEIDADPKYLVVWYEQL